MTTRRDFVEHILETKSFNEFYSRVFRAFEILENTENKNKLRIIRMNFSDRWKKARSNRKFFEQSYSSWLDEAVFFFSKASYVPSRSSEKRGRPKKSFSEAKERTQKKIVKSEADKVTTPLSIRVLSTRLRRRENQAGSTGVKLLASASPRSSKQLYAKLKREEKFLQPYTPEEALSLVIEAKLSKISYNVIRAYSKKKGADIYPRNAGQLGKNFIHIPQNP